jgi:hypothetical protein
MIQKTPSPSKTKFNGAKSPRKTEPPITNPIPIITTPQKISDITVKSLISPTYTYHIAKVEEEGGSNPASLGMNSIVMAFFVKPVALDTPKYYSTLSLNPSPHPFPSTSAAEFYG